MEPRARGWAPPVWGPVEKKHVTNNPALSYLMEREGPQNEAEYQEMMEELDEIDRTRTDIYMIIQEKYTTMRDGSIVRSKWIQYIDPQQLDPSEA